MLTSLVDDDRSRSRANQNKRARTVAIRHTWLRHGSRDRRYDAAKVRIDCFVLAAAVGLSSALSFAVHSIASRGMSVADYGGLVAVLALMTAAAVPVGAMQTAITRSASRIVADGQTPSGWPLMAQLVPASIVLAGVVTLVSPWVADFLNLESRMPVVLGGLWIAVVLVGATAKGLLISVEHHRPVAHSLVHGAIVRLAVVALLTPPLGIIGGVLAAVVGDLMSTLIYVVAAFRRGLLDRDGQFAQVEWPDAGRALSSQLSLWLLASLAVVFGRRGLSGADSGSFAAMATVAASCLFLPQAVATIIFPRFVADGSARVVVRATGLAALVGAACAAVLTVRPSWIFVVFFGPSYTPTRSVLLVLCLHFVLLGCLTVLSQYLVARRHTGVVSIWVGLLGASIGAERLGHTPMTLAVALVLPTAMVTAFVGFRAMASRHLSDVESSARSDVVLDLDRLDGGFALRQPPTLDVSVVIPSYNGGAQLRPCVESLCAALVAAGWRYEVIVSVDGSTDGSDATVDGLHPHVRVLRAPKNQGKGAALRRGFAVARGGVIGFIDGDGDIPASVMVDLFGGLLASHSWAAVATKNHPAADVSATAGRRVMSAAYRLIVHWMFDLEVTDTQCGCKAFRREFLAITVPQAREDGFALDLELLTIGAKLGMKSTIEVPVVLARATRGTISRRAVLRTFNDTLRIRRRLPQATCKPLPLSATTPVGVGFSSPLLP